jgi:hypothetical protein
MDFFGVFCPVPNFRNLPKYFEIEILCAEHGTRVSFFGEGAHDADQNYGRFKKSQNFG